MGNSKEIQRVEEKRWKVEKSVEDKEVMRGDDVLAFTERMKMKKNTERTEVIMMIKCYFGHVAKAHEEAASTAHLAKMLIDEVDETSFMKIMDNGTRPLVMLEVPEMMRQAANMKTDRELRQKAQLLREQPIEIVIQEQNLLKPKQRWAASKIMSPLAYLLAAVYYFLCNTADQSKTVHNHMVADLFKVSHSNLHKITSGHKYSGRSTTTTRKAKNLKELEEHGEQMVKVGKVKGKVAKKKVMVTKVKTTPQLVPLPFLEDTPALETWGQQKKTEKTEEKPMEH